MSIIFPTGSTKNSHVKSHVFSVTHMQFLRLINFILPSYLAWVYAELSFVTNAQILICKSETKYLSTFNLRELQVD